MVIDVVASTRGLNLGLLSPVADGGGATSLLALKKASHLALIFASSLSLRTVQQVLALIIQISR